VGLLIDIINTDGEPNIIEEIIKTNAMKHKNIQWERGSLEDEAGDGHVYFYEAFGTNAAGVEYTGIWVECDGELDEITDIQEA